MGNEQSSGVAASEASAAEVAAEAAAAEAAARQLSEGARALGEWARPLAERVQRAQRRLDHLEATVAAMAVFGADADQALKRLDTRVAALEAAVERALAAMFPRVETLLAHLEFLALPLGGVAVRTPSTAAPGLPSQSSATTSRASPAKSFVSATPTPATTSASPLPGSSTADSSSRSTTPKTTAPATKKHPSPHKPSGSNHRTTSSGSKATLSSSKTASNSKPASPNPKSTPSTSKIVLICRSKSSSFRSSSGNLHANPSRSRANSLTGEPSRSETQVPANVLQNSPEENMPSSSFCIRRTTNTSEETSTQPDCSTSSKSVRSAMKTGSMSKTSIEGRKKKCSRPFSTILNPSCDPSSSTISTPFSESSTTSTSSTLLSSFPLTSSVAPIPSISQPMNSNSITSTGVPLISPAISTPTTSGESSSSPMISLDSHNLSSVPRNKKAHPPDSSGERRRKILTRPTSSSFDKYSSSTAFSTQISSTSVASIDNGTLPTNSSLVRTAISTDTVSPTPNPSSCGVTTSPSSTASTSDAGIGSDSSPNLSSGNSNSSSWEMVPFAKNSPGASDDSRVARSTEKSEVTKAVEADSVMAMGADVELSEAAVAETMEATEAVMSRGAIVELSEATRVAEEATGMVNVTKPGAVAATTAMAAELSEAARAAEAAEIPAAVDVEDLSGATRAVEAAMEGRASRAVDDSTTAGAGVGADASDAVAEGRVEPPEVENAAEVLLQAARDGDITRLEALLDEGRCEVNAPCGVSGGTVAHWAALRGRADLLRLLLRRGADVRRRDAARWTPLHAAAFGRSARCVELLVAAGAEVEGADRDGWTALHLAAVRGAAGATRALLAAGACASARDRDGRTPAQLAASQALRSILGGDAVADRAREGGGGGGDVADVCGARDARDARDI
ncbi:hypothetical protein R5R35_008000 [Gryllus longicercus]|uniref:Uncharacterized protein n=1 Tax=Gryllus longicercus TaxID=2509291 RepID=A0AAN9Z1R0_9ORTH